MNKLFGLYAYILLLCVAITFLVASFVKAEPIRFQKMVETPNVTVVEVVHAKIRMKLLDENNLFISEKNITIAESNYQAIMDAGARLLNSNTGSDVTGSDIIQALTQVLGEL